MHPAVTDMRRLWKSSVTADDSDKSIHKCQFGRHKLLLDLLSFHEDIVQLTITKHWKSHRTNKSRFHLVLLFSICY